LEGKSVKITSSEKTVLYKSFPIKDVISTLGGGVIAALVPDRRKGDFRGIECVNILPGYEIEVLEEV